MSVIKSESFQKIKQDTLGFLKSKTSVKPKIAVVLGSGFSNLSSNNSVKISFSEIPHFQTPSVESHKGFMEFGYIEDVSVLILKGRFHLYEGYSISEVVYPIRLLPFLGVETLILTGAVGGLDPTLKVGDFVILKDQINLTGNNPLIGKKSNNRFLDMSDAYDVDLIEILETCLKELNFRFKQGVYCGVHGPVYETPAEVSFMKMIGGHVVGMSVVNECIAARECGLRVSGITCVSNTLPSINKKLTHKEVFSVIEKKSDQFSTLLRAFIRKLTKNY